MSLDIIARPLGEILLFIYNIAFHNYGMAIVIFTVVVKVVLMPLTVKQYKSSSKMQELQPLIQEVQKRYKNDKEKLNQELMKYIGSWLQPCRRMSSHVDTDAYTDIPVLGNNTTSQIFAPQDSGPGFTIGKQGYKAYGKFRYG